jgi:hypothetical protein
MPKPITDFYSFPAYQTREAFEAATGETAPPWNLEKPLKNWRDPAPTNTEFDELLGEFAKYKPVLSILPNGRYREGADGQPTTGSMRLSVEDAKSVNFLPAKGIVPVAGEIINGMTITPQHVANASRSVPVPLNLPEGSRIAYAPSIGANVVVLLKDESLTPVGNGFTAEDRELLRRIATKVGA